LINLVAMDKKLSRLLEMLEEDSIQITGARGDLRHYFDHMGLDPSRLHELEQHLSR
jgi:DNA repair protein RecN (Recombination protein N)